jgi:hypothetical protein
MTWDKYQIYEASLTPLAPLLRDLGFVLRPLPHGAFLVASYEDLTINYCFWQWPSHGLRGNAIEFFTQVRGLSFQQAMFILTQNA